MEFRQATCKKAAAKASAKKPKRQIRPAAKKRERRCSKKDENKIKKAHKEPEAAHTGSPKKRAAAEASPKASDRVKSPAQNQKRRPDEKATDEKTVRIQENPEKKVPKRKPSSKQTTENQLRTKINGTVTSHRNKSAQNGRKLLKKAMMICLQQEFLILTK